MVSFYDWYAEQRVLLSEVPIVGDPLDYVIAHCAQRTGTWVEFGVGDGTRLRRIAAARGNATLYGFDWFRGLPEDWRPEFPKGSFATAVPDVPGAELVVGLFEETVPYFFANLRPSGPVTFAHVDCDLYAGAKVALEHMLPHLSDGAVVAFDELLAYTGHEEHELKALYETHLLGLHFEWIARDGGEKAALRVRTK